MSGVQYMIETPFMSERPVVCILAALNSYSGYDVFTVNPLSRPTTLRDFIREFRNVIDGEELTLVGIPGRVFHALYLAKIYIPHKIFASKGAHIYNYVYMNYYWWHIDSATGVCEKVHNASIGLHDDILYLPYLNSEISTIKTALQSWKPPVRGGLYYEELRLTLLKAFSEVE